MPFSTSSPEPIRLEPRESVAVLWLNHPPVNVLDRTLLESLGEALRHVEAEARFRAVVIASALEKVFAAGASIREMATLDPKGAREHGGRGQSVTLQIERLPLPVLAAVHGVCLGGACEIVQACDLVLASPDATFGQPEINLGVMPGWGGTQRLPRRIGASRARAWVFTGRPARAIDAHQSGLVLEVVERPELLARTMAIAHELATKPPGALASAKFALNHAIDPGLSSGLSYERDLWSELFGSSDQREGMAAFLEKRSPKFGERETGQTHFRGVRGISAARGEPPKVRTRSRRPKSRSSNRLRS